MTDNTNRIAGILGMSIDGAAYDVRGEASYKVSTSKREAMMGLSGFNGYKETPDIGEMAVTLSDSGGVSATAVGNITNSTIIFNLANGKIVVGRNMFCTEKPDGSADDGTLKATFNGPQVSDN